jgi:ATP synthase F1 complex assembly factor 2
VPTVLTGLALIRGVIDVEQARAAARVEEDFQIEEWGLVEGGHDVDLADIRIRLSSPRVMINLLRHHR